MSDRPLRPSRLVAPCLAALLLSATLAADEAPTGYRLPSPEIVEVIDAEPTPAGSVSPDGTWLLLEHRTALLALEDLAREELGLAGVRIDPATNGPTRVRYRTGLTLQPIDGGPSRAVTGLPAEPRLGDVAWSPDGSRALFTHTTGDGVELWVLEVAAAEARRLTDRRLNLATRGAPFWDPSGSSILALLVPADRGEAPERSRVPPGPVVQESIGRAAPARTYQDLLEDAHDEALFEHYFTAQVARIAVGGEDGRVTALGAPGIVGGLDVSPDGRFLLVERVLRPFSYRLPAWRFPKRIEVLDRDGAPVKVLAEKGLQDEIPIAFGSVETGPREFSWRSDAPATLVWAEALDGGDAGREAEHRDDVFLLSAPFTGDAVRLARLELRYRGVVWGDGDLALLTSWWWKTRMTRTWRVRPDQPEAAPELLVERSFQDRYADPGDPRTRRDAAGRRVLLTTPDGSAFYRIGEGASPEGNRPFLDRVDVATGETTRLFRSEAPWFEEPLEILDPEARRILVLRESKEQPPNFAVRTLGGADGEAGDALRRLTDFPDPTPALTGVSKEILRYRRDDGVELTGTLYLPAGYDAERDGPLPALVWAYPREFKSADDAGQVDDSPHRFVRVWWGAPELWVLRGYAVLDGATMPIVGEGDAEPNDTYVDQLVASAKAAVDELVRRGVGDPERMAVGGHSYGAFMAANLLAHSDLFAAGIARSGAYNRTLTPFGFQAEERTFWQSPEVYFAMSPFMHADAIDEPILLIHGAEDDNSGTFPMQSERLYAALQGLGGTARLVMLPLESHSYRARTSILHMLWETEQWLERWVKAVPETAAAAR